MTSLSDMIWTLLFIVDFSNIYVHAVLSMYYSTTNTWRDSRENCTLVSQEILCGNSLSVCKKELRTNNTKPLAWIDGHVIRSPWYTYDSQIVDNSSLEKTLDSFNDKEIGSNCASILQSGNALVIEHKPCQERLRLICTNCSITLSNCSVYPTNHMLTWEESRRKCKEYNSTLILRPANLRISNDVRYWLGYYRNETVKWNKGPQENDGILCLAVGRDWTNILAIDCRLRLHGICVFAPTDTQGSLNWILFPVTFGISVVIGLVLYLLCLIMVLIVKRCRIQNDVTRDKAILKPISSRKELYFDPKLTGDTQDLPPCLIRRNLSTFPMKSKTISGHVTNKESTLPSEWRLERAHAEFQSDPYLNRDPQPLPFHEPSRTITVHHSCSSLRYQDECISVKVPKTPCSHVHKISREMTDKHDSCESVDRESEINHHKKVHDKCKPGAEQTIRLVSNDTPTNDGHVSSPTMRRTSFLLRLNNTLKFPLSKTENEGKPNKTDLRPKKDHIENVELKTNYQKMKEDENYIKMNHPTRQSDNPESRYISMTDPRSTRKVKVDEHGYAEVLT